ncbi:hypothetical protein FGB62_407g05 [Gracilaria domingensis]|nr:hypothetical protein FGB62_407g05 [Gracilaria domingensis]
MSYTETKHSFSPSAPPQAPPPGYPEVPQPSHQQPLKYYSQLAYNSSSATCSERPNYPQGASYSQRPYEPTPDLPSPEYDTYPPASQIPHSRSSPAVSIHHRPPPHHAFSCPMPGHD